MQWGFASESGGPLTSRIDMNLIGQIQRLISDSTPLRDFAIFDPETVLVDDFPSDAYEDQLDAYLESAAEKNTLRMEELEYAAQDDLEILRTGLDTLCDQIKSVLSDIANDQSKIDNT